MGILDRIGNENYERVHVGWKHPAIETLRATTCSSLPYRSTLQLLTPGSKRGMNVSSPIKVVTTEHRLTISLLGEVS